MASKKLVLSTICALALATMASAGNSTATADCDPSQTMPCSTSFMGNALLMIFYGILLCVGAKLISDGSELLLEILDPGIIGGFVLPVLGAVPDAAIILVSGTGPIAVVAQNLLVGVGTLAGSTIFLLTIPWAISLVLARTDIGPNGMSIDKKLTKGWDLHQTGASVTADTPSNFKWMICTSVSYLVIQGIAFAYLSSDATTAAKHEKPFAIVTFAMATIFFLAYSIYQVYSSRAQAIQEARMKLAHEQKKQEEMLIKYRHTILKAFNKKSPMSVNGEVSSASKPLLSEADQQQRDAAVAKSYGSKWRASAAASTAKKNEELALKVQEEKAEEAEEDSDDEEESSGLTPRMVALKAACLLALGVAFVSIFSDPMVDTLSNMGIILNISAFYISFIVTPLVSNASETISSLIFAAKKKKANTSVTYSQLAGAATMNNTLCLGIFMALIAFRGLSWTFSSEVVVILLTQIVVFYFSRHQTYKLWYAIPVLAMYPAALAVVAFLEDVVGWQ